MFIAALAVLALGSVVFSAAHLYSRLHALRAAESGMLYFFLIVVLGFSFQGSIAGTAFAQSASPPVVGASAPPTNPGQGTYPKHVQELVDYLECLRKAKCSFSLTGEETAQQLGYSRLFASAYDEMILRIKAYESNTGRASTDDVIAQFEAIVREEQAIEKLLSRNERHAVAIAYLRALQNGDVAFPPPLDLAPVPSILLVQVMASYPDVRLDIYDQVFATIYRKTRELSAIRVKNTGEIRTHELIAEFRRLILASAETPESSTPTVCDKDAAIGALEAVTRSCPRLRLSETAKATLLDQRADGVCRRKAESDVAMQLNLMQNSKITNVCRFLEEQVRARRIVTLSIVR